MKEQGNKLINLLNELEDRQEEIKSEPETYKAPTRMQTSGLRDLIGDNIDINDGILSNSAHLDQENPTSNRFVENNS